MQNVIIISLGNEIDRYAELLKEEFGIIRMPADSALTKDLSSARFILYSFRAIQYRLDNRIKNRTGASDNCNSKRKRCVRS